MKYGRKPKRIRKESDKVKVKVSKDQIIYGRRSRKSYFEDEDISIGRN